MKTTTYIIYQETLNGGYTYRVFYSEVANALTYDAKNATHYQIRQNASDLIEMMPMLKDCKICTVETTYKF